MEGNQRRGLIRGMAFGAAVALLGTLGIAVADYSGNVISASGNENEAPVHAEHAIGAIHTWYDSFEDGGSLRYSFGAWRADSVSGSDQPAHEKGGVFAGIERCTNRADAETCSWELWKGGIDVSKSDGHQALRVDPNLLTASFYGDLFNTETGEGCHFDVRWTAERQNPLDRPTDYNGAAWWALTAPQGMPERQDERSLPGPTSVPVARTAAFSRDSFATLTSECWDIQIEPHEGQIWRNTRLLTPR